MNSRLGKLLESSVAVVVAANLDNLPSADVHLLEVPWDVKDRVAKLPAVLVSPIGAETIPPNEGTVAADDISPAILIAIIDSKAAVRESLSRWDQSLLWREKLIDAFIRIRMLGPGNEQLCDTVTIEPNPIVDPGAWLQRQLYLSTFAIRPMTRVRRRA